MIKMTLYVIGGLYFGAWIIMLGLLCIAYIRHKLGCKRRE
jgi:hypothetical protein